MRADNAVIKSTLLVIVVTPLFLGEVVRTYSWIIVLGNSGFINSMLRSLGVIQHPIQFMFTTFGVVVALVHVTMPVMVIMLAAALSHIERDYQKAAESLGAGPVRVFLTGIVVALIEQYSSIWLSARWTQTAVFVVLVIYLSFLAFKASAFSTRLRRMLPAGKA